MDLQCGPERLLELGLVAERQQRLRPDDRLADARLLVQVALLAQARHGADDPRGDPLGHLRQPGLHDRALALGRRVVDPVVQAAALERVVQLPGAVGGQHHDRPPRGGDRPELGDRDREVRQELQQERLELVVGAVDLVDQQHDGLRGIGFERLQQRPAQQEAPAEQLALVDAALGRPQRQQLARVVPVVDRVVQVDPLVALQPDQPRAGRRRQRPRDLGLADAGLALQQQRLLERRGQVDRQRQRPVGQISLRREGIARGADSL